MTIRIMLVLLFGVLVGMSTRADEAQVVRPRWIIIVTITDLTTGERIEQRELDPNLEFDESKDCKSIVDSVRQIPRSEHFGAVLTCRKVERKKANL